MVVSHYDSTVGESPLYVRPSYARPTVFSRSHATTSPSKSQKPSIELSDQFGRFPVKLQLEVK
jgi:hypothetical protein